MVPEQLFLINQYHVVSGYCGSHAQRQVRAGRERTSTVAAVVVIIVVVDDDRTRRDIIVVIIIIVIIWKSNQPSTVCSADILS